MPQINAPLDASPSDTSVNKTWPFDAWLRLAVRGFRLTPAAFWSMSVRDWLTLTRAESVPAMGADELSALSLQFPDEVTYEPGKP